uniref:Uncharacterized protein n=1 Tax=Anopheles melas TaxID=34690 RepID=A0A182UEV7_9DIPT
MFDSRHVWMIFFARQSLHFTSQHQWKVQEQRSTTVTSCVRYPRPQHIRSQPSTPIEVSLHWRPCVPCMPSRGLRSQKPGDAWIELLSTLLGLADPPTLFAFVLRLAEPARFVSVFSFTLVLRKLLLTMTRDAPSNRSFSMSPIVRKLFSRIQHVFIVHEPDIPWHLHSCRISASPSGSV